MDIYAIDPLMGMIHNGLMLKNGVGDMADAFEDPITKGIVAEHASILGKLREAEKLAKATYEAVSGLGKSMLNAECDAEALLRKTIQVYVDKFERDLYEKIERIKKGETA